MVIPHRLERSTFDLLLIIIIIIRGGASSSKPTSDILRLWVKCAHFQTTDLRIPGEADGNARAGGDVCVCLRGGPIVDAGDCHGAWVAASVRHQARGWMHGSPATNACCCRPVVECKQEAGRRRRETFALPHAAIHRRCSVARPSKPPEPIGQTQGQCRRGFLMRVHMQHYDRLP
jgi:hypothetical protein